MKHNKEILLRVKELKEQWYKSKEIKKIIEEELWIVVSDRTVRWWLKNKIDQLESDLKKLNEEIESKKTFEIVENKDWSIDVIMYRKVWEETHRYVFPLELIVNIFKDYSRYGGNLSGLQIQRKYNLKPEAWQLLKNRLNLYKDSDVIPDWALEYVEWKWGENKVEEVIRDVTYEAVQNKYKNKLVKQYERQKDREYEKAIKKLYDLEEFLWMLKEYLESYQPEKFIDIEDFNKLHEQNLNKHNSDTLYTAITDIHIGKEDTDEIIERIQQVTEYICNRLEKNVKMFILWDLFETIVVWGMHKWQIENMDWPFTFDLIMKTVEVFEKMFIKIYSSWKKLDVYWIISNHWRISERDHFDYTGDLIVYEMIRRWLKQLEIEINYLREVWNTVETEDFTFILQHWHIWWTKRRLSDILWEYGNSQKYNILLQGHIHSGVLEEWNRKWMRIIVPSLAGEGMYNKALGISSSTWFVIIKKWIKDKPEVSFIYLD